MWRQPGEHAACTRAPSLVNTGVDTDTADPPRNAAVLVAHPDDETLWAGGTILQHPSWNWYIVTLCRASDPDRAPRFRRALRELGAAGAMGDLDDGPAQTPLEARELQQAVLGLVPQRPFDLLVTHDPAGEYTRHLRHEEASRTAIALWQGGGLQASELWTFAYEDGGRQYLPRPMAGAALRAELPEAIWKRKYEIITRIYGLPADGFEARTTPRAEAFWRFTRPDEAQRWAEKRGGRQ